MLIKRPDDIPSSEITPESVYLNRRRFMSAFAAGALAGALDPELLVGAELARPRAPRREEDEPTPYEAVTTSTSSASRKRTRTARRTRCARGPGPSPSKGT